MLRSYAPQLILILLCSSFGFSQTTHEKELPMTIEHDMVLTKNTAYLIQDYLHVSNGATLTIEEGVSLKNSKHHNVTIVIDGGSRVIASGTYKNPIKAVSDTMTSEKAVIIMKSSLKENKSVVTNDFHYDTIDHPTLLLNPKPLVSTQISSVSLDLDIIDEVENTKY